ncbi:DUF5801 repeats-in-toxin domain-containing protein [Pseudomonas sp. P9_31]|uniref:DUF5801 repeats-in-toxin domain-containing protein n=1 Tax=Pseudomonas sp. P9_31 TaxID=3043448 RepID=UPI002A360791|nr:DUF5801 repeats-in-toxin domain-containing protein [Pseudomonas sp. P9_31]WPN60375.1 DUF5801 repeats-in-toxin domain-containing protein [Pseudomonas sp. P9_31]
MTIREQNSSLTSDPTSLYAATLDSVATASVTANALSVTPGANVTLDETAGLQNATATPSLAGDADDNDILVASLPSTFSTRLTALGAGTATGAALSGYTGAVGDTGSNAFTLTGAPGTITTDISFVDSAGAPLNGLDSGLDTLDGTSILLYTDTNNNIVVGRAGAADGAIVFAAYIEETGSPVSGGKIWTVEYQPLKHPDASNPDDAVNLLNKVFIGATQDLAFSLAGAPSGQNLFLMYTKANPTTEVVNGVTRITDPTIIATGKDPADQSSGAHINTGDTINTSQGGGPTTIGTNNQMIVEQEGIRFSFVTGARQDVTVPNLSQTEADVESNIDFTGVYNSTSANFDIVQLQSGKSAVVKVSAFSTAAEPGANFINGYANDTPVAITNVQVINNSTGLVIENSDGSVNDPTITISFTGGVATITGVKAGYQIEYTTTSDHNRVLIENGAALDARGDNHADFDVGGFSLRQASTSTAEIGSKMIFEDDGPRVSATGTEPTLTVDETVLATNDTQSFTANFSSAFGADGAGTLTYALGVVAGGSGLTDTATGEAVNLSLNGAVVEGRTATTNLLVFTVSVAANGDVTLDQQRAVVHPDATNPDDSTSLTSDDLVTLKATITDKDGDSAQATLNIGQNLVFKDDGPSISTTGTEPTLTVDETVLTTDDTQSFTANFSSAFGADGAGTLTYALGVVAGGSGLTDTATGEAVNLSLNGAVVEGRTATTNLLVFTVSVAANGDVTLDQQRAVVHPDATNPDDSTSLTSDDLVTLKATITDKDGDSAQATLNIGQNLVFKDDGPSISTTGSEPTLTVDETVLTTDATQSFTANFSSAFGADGAGTLTYALGVVAGGSGLTDTATGEAVNLSLNGAVVEGRTATTNLLVFTVSVAANGDVTLDQQRAVVHPDATNPDDSTSLTSDDLVTLKATITDKDGDSAQATLNIGQNLVFKDDGPSISTTGTEPTLTVDETVLTTDATQNFAANFSSAFGADGAGTLTYALGVVAGGSGLTDTATGEAVNLSLNGAVVEGRTATTNLLVFTVSVAANGDVTLDQQRAVVHPDAANPDDSTSLTSDDLVTLKATITDKDGDSAHATLNIGQNLVFKDDGPSISTTGSEPTLTVDETVLTTDATQSFTANFSSAFGADGAGTLTYALGVVAGGSGLTDTATGEAVNLSLNGAVVEGRTAISNLLVFTVSVAANGDVTLDQQRAVVHPDATNPDDSTSLSADDLVTLKATITDKDGDSAHATLNIGQNLVFKDDGPSISTTGSEPTLTVDETVLTTDDTQSFTANFSSAFGADGAGTLTYALGVVAGGSGLTDTATGEAVNLSLNGAVVEGRTATTNLLVFTVSVAANGDVTLDQQRAVVHPDPNNPDDSTSLTSDDLVTLKATITDKDGDSAQATLNIGQNLVFKDDGPSISTTGTEPTLTVDETVLTTDATQSFTANFSSAFGADGAGTLTYALGVVAGGSGLTDTATGEAVNLSLNGAVVEGRTATTNLLVFTVSVAANGDVTLDQQRAVVHPDATNPDDSTSLSADDLVTLKATITDKDGDSAQATLNIGQNLVFKDDGPSISTTGTEPTLTVDETVLTTDATQSFTANFSSAFGADGAGTLTYALGVVAGGSGLTDTATGEAVNLSLNGAVVEGRTAISNLLVFTVSVAANGDVTLDQQRAVVHPDATNPDDSTSLSSDDLVTLTATITDKDGDSAHATLNIGQNLVFKDDGPSISTTGTEPTLTVDETVLTTDDTQSFTANFSSAFGADGAGTLTYALGVVAGGSGLTDTATGEAVNLSLNGGVVQGRTAISNLLVFTASVAANGDVTLDQQRAVVHPDPNNPDDSTSLSSDNLVTLTATITDKDGDSAHATLNIGQNLVFEDDGPTLAFGNLIGTGSVLPQTGYWDNSIGADGLGATGLDISLVNNQFTLVRPDNTTTTGTGTLTEQSPSPDANGAFHFAGTLTGDFDNNAATANTSVDYTLTAFANGSYALDLVQGFSSQIVLSSADGSLSAGGPDPVRTLLIPETNDPTIPSASEEVVFFSAKATASTADILTGIGLGAPDPTEAQLQTNPLPSYIDPAAMNVSTAGIGIANNLFQGDNLAAISAADESFVINPESLLTSMKVFIDNSVGGYNTATEDLYYRAYYEDGTFSNLIEVNTLTPEAGGQVSFLIQSDGTKLIDAVQLTMARGEIKIPVIEFTHETESLASDVKLAFNATLTDKDGDSATSTFDANLFANDLGTTFDFTLVGTSGERDAFNVDLSFTQNKYQVTGFDANAGLRDTLVLNGDQNAVVQSIDNSGADSIVTVAEMGGQITTITLVGVDLLSSDIVHGSA